MRKIIFSMSSILMLTSCSGFTPTHVSGGENINPFDFPGNSLVSELTIDGHNLETQWQPGEYTTNPYVFTYKNKLSGESYEWSFTIYRGLKELFVFYKVYDCNICSYGNDNGSSVSYSDSCELYLDTRLDGGNKPQSDDYQIDLGVNGKTRVLCGNGTGWSPWNGIVQYESYIDGTLNSGDDDVDNYYCIEVSVPYKQIGITRDQDIGITLGICDRYIESGSTTNKQWYGVTINGHFGNPQDPSTYFILKKNTLELPPIPEYDPSKDETDYADDFDMKIPSTNKDGIKYPEITYKIGRNNNIVSALVTTNDKWPLDVGVTFFFDFGNQNRGERDQYTIILRAYPGARSLLDFYQYPRTGLNKKDLTIQMNDNCCFVSFNFENYLAPENEDVNFCAASMTNDSSRTLVKVLGVDGNQMNSGDLKTYGKLTKENKIEIKTNDRPYNPNEDSTDYINNSNLTMLEKTIDGIKYAAKTIDVARNGNNVIVLFKNSEKWNSDEQLMISLDLGSSSRTTRDGATSILRFFPKIGSIHDFFLYPNSGIDKTIPVFEFFNNAVKVTIDISKYVDLIPGYEDQGAGVAFTLCDSNSKVISYCLYNDEVMTTNLSTWPRLSSNNTIL